MPKTILDFTIRLIGFQSIGFLGFQNGVSIMVLERNKAYLLSYQNGGKGRATYRVVLVTSVQDDVIYATPIRKLAAWEAEREVCRRLECGFFTKRPHPQTYKPERIRHVKTDVKNYREYMDGKVKNLVNQSLDEMANAR